MIRRDTLFSPLLATMLPLPYYMFLPRRYYTCFRTLYYAARDTGAMRFAMLI